MLVLVVFFFFRMLGEVCSSVSSVVIRTKTLLGIIRVIQVSLVNVGLRPPFLFVFFVFLNFVCVSLSFVFFCFFYSFFLTFQARKSGHIAAHKKAGRD